jgi:hypothetical protein
MIVVLCNINEIYSQYALRILQWLAYSARPLQIGELVDIIAVNIEGDPRFDVENRLKNPREILIICSSLVTLSAKTTEGSHNKTIETVVTLAHFSVKEYLVSERIRKGPASKYSIEEIPANISISEICLAYLLQFDKPSSLDPDTIEYFPLARYTQSIG